MFSFFSKSSRLFANLSEKQLKVALSVGYTSLVAGTYLPPLKMSPATKLTDQDKDSLIYNMPPGP